ncbi:MAG: phosphatase PAP2 family protein [Deltaproteobacteria bacterium]
MRAVLALAVLVAPNVASATQTATSAPDITAVDVGVTLGLTATLGALVTLMRRPPERGWKGDLPLDRVFADSVTLRNSETRNQLSHVSDYLQNGLILAPFVMDIGATALIAEQDLDLAASMFFMDLEAVAVATLFTLLTKRSIGRVRPLVDPCPGTIDDFSCRALTGRSAFVSGHSVASFASAGLVCAHHDFLELWGGGAADAAACATAIGLAASTAALRVTSGRHYISDVVAGALGGLFAGYAVPYLAHFATHAPRERIHGAIAVRAAAGAITSGGNTALAAGIDAAFEHRHTFEAGFTAALGTHAAALHARDGGWLRRVAPYAGFELGGVGAGAVLDYRARRLASVSAAELLVGARLSAAWRRPEHGVSLAVTWLPLVDGDGDDFTARVDVALKTHLSLGAEVVTTFDGDHAATLGLGGRLPW